MPNTPSLAVNLWSSQKISTGEIKLSAASDCGGWATGRQA
jgi:hypothetical protein